MISSATWEAEFLFALRNRTGKYFIGRDLLDDQSDLFAKVRYGRIARRQTPTGRVAKAIALAAGREIRLRAQHPGLPGRIRRPRPVLHLDPLTVPLYDIGPRDAVLSHDLGPITHPELFKPGVATLYRAAYERTAAAQPAMVFVSRASRDAYIAQYGATPEMHVVYPPLRVELSNARPDPVAQVTQPFLLTVGSIGRRKNQKASIEAFARSGLAGQGWSYVLCGTQEPGAGDVMAAAEKTPGVVVLSYVSDGALVWLYRNASGFVLASKLEGFGVPVAEAIAAGLVPIVTSDSVLEEVAGDGALAVDPHDIGAIARAMTSLAQMGNDEKARRQDLLARSVERFSPGAFREGWRAVLNTSSTAKEKSRFLK